MLANFECWINNMKISKSEIGRLMRLVIRLIAFIILPFVLVSSCKEEVEQVDCADSDLSIEIAKIKYADCGLSNGEITVSASGGKAPYRYSFDGDVTQTSTSFINVKPGFHVFSVIDVTDCKSTVDTFMANKEPFPVNTTTKPSGCDGNLGSITVVPLGGVPPYKYQLGENNDNYQTSNTWEGLRSGKHSVWVEDINKCFFGFDVYVPTGISYKDLVAPVIEAKCSTSLCHGGSQAPDLRTFSVIKSNALKIKTVVVNLSMPKDNPLTSSEIQMITCWVDDGALNN